MTVSDCPHGSPILKFSDIIAEQEGHAFLYRGAIGAIKNPLSHRRVGHKAKARAFELIAFASALMREELSHEVDLNVD